MATTSSSQTGLDPEAIAFLHEGGINDSTIRQLKPDVWDVDHAIDWETADLNDRGTYLLGKLYGYVKADLTDEILLFQFIEDFEGWSTDDFRAVGKKYGKITGMYRHHFHQRGIYLGRTANITLGDLIEAKDLVTVPDWPEGALRKAKLLPQCGLRREQAQLFGIGSQYASQYGSQRGSQRGRSGSRGQSESPAPATSSAKRTGKAPQGLQDSFADPTVAPTNPPQNLTAEGAPQRVPSPAEGWYQAPSGGLTTYRFEGQIPRISPISPSAEAGGTRRLHRSTRGPVPDPIPTLRDPRPYTASAIPEPQAPRAATTARAAPAARATGDPQVQDLTSHVADWRPFGHLWIQDYMQGIVTIDRQAQPANRSRKQLPLIPRIPDWDPEDEIHYIQIPPLRVAVTAPELTTLASFSKGWVDKHQYNGEPYSVLDDTIKMFYEVARGTGVKPSQFRHVFWKLLSGKALDYYRDHVGGLYDFATLYWIIKTFFETDVNQATYHTDWSTLTLRSMQEKSPGKDRMEVLEELFRKLHNCQRALGREYEGEVHGITALKRAVRNDPAFDMALFIKADSLTQLQENLRSSLKIHTDRHAGHQYLSSEGQEASRFAGERATNQHYADRGYGQAGRGSVYPGTRSEGPTRFNRFKSENSGRFRGDQAAFRRPGPRGQGPRQRGLGKCFICGDPKCRSWKHPQKEQDAAKRRWEEGERSAGRRIYHQAYEAYAQIFESSPDGEEDDEIPDPAAPQALEYYSEEEGQDSQEASAHYMEAATVDITAFHQAEALVNRLLDRSFEHRLTTAIPVGSAAVEASQFVLAPQPAEVYQGILPDTGAAEFSTVGQRQWEALKRVIPDLTLDTAQAGKARIRFGNGDFLTSLGATSVRTPLGRIVFHLLPTVTPFLLCLKDMNDLGIYYNNVDGKMLRVSDGEWAPVVIKWGHPWFFTDPEMAHTIAFLTEAEMRRLHRRFGHPAVHRLHKVLLAAGHEVDFERLQWIQKVCNHCQMKGPAPQRFRFSLNDKDRDFNAEIIVDIFFLDGQPVLHVVDVATAFQAGKFLDRGTTGQDLWEAIRQCWIDVYLGPPDVCRVDAGKNFTSREFRSSARLNGVTVEEVPVEAHHRIGKVERYHAMVRRAYEIITAETQGSITKEAALQSTFKAVNDTAGPDGLVPTLLVFGAYPRMTMDSPPSPTQLQRAQAIQKAMAELRRLQSRRLVNEARNTRNGPDLTDRLPSVLKLGSEVRVWREKSGWKGPYHVIAIGQNDVTVQTINGPLRMASTHVVPFKRHTEEEEGPLNEDEERPIPFDYPPQEQPNRVGRPRKALTAPENGKRVEEPVAEITVKRKPGRPRGSKNKPKPSQIVLQKFLNAKPTNQGPVSAIQAPQVEAQVAVEDGAAETFLSQKEVLDRELSLKLRSEGKIKAPGAPFEESDKKEINALLEAGVLLPVQYRPEDFPDAAIFGARVVREVKDKFTSKPYEKSRLVVCGFNDDGKAFVLTQAPTIQRSSQRILFALAPALLEMEDDNGAQYCLMGRDITQAYVQAKSTLTRLVLLRIPRELKEKYPEGTVFKVMKPLYGLAESGMHWYATYSKHHIEKLRMATSPFDPCLFVTKKGVDFGLTVLQTDDTLNLGTKAFMDQEQAELKKAGFKAKPQQFYGEGSFGDFNGCHLELKGGDITVTQKGQAEKLKAVDFKSPTFKQDYAQQRARGAYLVTMCQPEAAFALSVAAQVTDPKEEDVKSLNTVLQWQMDNKQRGLQYKPVDLTTAKLYCFTDGSFANNADLTSQIGFVIVLGNEAPEGPNEVTITGNLIHWTSTKCKRVTRSVLASEIYGMVGGFDLGFCIKATINEVCDRLGISPLPLVICTDSLSVYQCLVQLGSTTEKRLMIDIMSLREAYENREIDEIRWIHGEDNPADSMTKKSANGALERLVTFNKTTIRLQGWVRR
jgi:Reverse transcriptase (RNA-dependent DNA polymerase)